ncbi:MAG: hypothetical protein EOQ39_33440 [Mesorhizobium sp.]|nr:MAG: hypothetical protein EOQ37_35105 [Mesorhizobium sp.]RWB09545.1 MAG: hypothetical protein EOQ39_33440 [Mesorhizobium sp.]
MRTRNVRLAVIKACFHFLEHRVPPCLDQARRFPGDPDKVDEEASDQEHCNPKPWPWSADRSGRRSQRVYMQTT